MPILMLATGSSLRRDGDVVERKFRPVVNYPAVAQRRSARCGASDEAVIERSVGQFKIASVICNSRITGRCYLDRIATEAEFGAARLSAMAAQLVPAAEIHWSLP